MAVALLQALRHAHLPLPLLLPLLLLLLLLFLLPLATSTKLVYVVTPSGVLEGTEDTTAGGLPYYAFRGIPYARPPTGNRRWKLPDPALPFEDDVCNATAFKPACPQGALLDGRETDEDCLYLDVYVHHYTAHVVTNVSKAWSRWRDWRENQTALTDQGGDALLPVMVYVHGGSYKSGSSADNAAGKVAAEQFLLVVVIQYRLGALGFLSSGSSELPGNYGFWDMRLALQWVKDNIVGFGGDAARVTAAGESAGSASVSQLTLSPRLRGLFQRAVLMSGTADATWCFNPHPRDIFDRFSQHAGCGDVSTSTSSRLQCLMTLPADVIYNISVVTEAGQIVTFVPTYDGDLFPQDLPQKVEDEDYLTSVGFYDYDLLVGTLNNEGVLAYGQLVKYVPSLPATGRVPYLAVDQLFLKAVMFQQLGPHHGPSTLDVANNDYFYPRYPGETSVHVSKLFDLYTDTDFIIPAVRTVRRHAGARSSPPEASSGSPAESSASSAGPGKSYLYYFDWIPSLTEGTIFEGMPHALDVDYLWGLTNDSLLLWDELPLGGSIQPREHEVSKLYGDMIGAFVRTGDPNDGLPDDIKGQWLPYDVNNETFLRFSLTPSVDHHLHADRVSLWMDLMPRLHSRWLNLTATQGPWDSTPRPPTDSTAGPTGSAEDLTFLGLREDEVDTLLIALLAVCGVLLLFCVFLLVRVVVMASRKTTGKDSPGRG